MSQSVLYYNLEANAIHISSTDNDGTAGIERDRVELVTSGHFQHDSLFEQIFVKLERSPAMVIRVPVVFEREGDHME